MVKNCTVKKKKQPTESKAVTQSKHLAYSDKIQYLINKLLTYSKQITEILLNIRKLKKTYINLSSIYT